MSTITTPTTETKKSNVSKVKKEKKVSEVSKINLSKFAEKLSKIEVKEKKSKQTIYIYPETFSITDINNEKGKKHRNSLRGKIRTFANNIFVFTKSKDNAKLVAEVKSFDAFYKANYRIQDYSLTSITNTKDESKEANISFMLDIIKEVKKK